MRDRACAIRAGTVLSGMRRHRTVRPRQFLGRLNRHMQRILALLISAAGFSQVVAADLRVGSDAACTHPDLQTALAAIAGVGGDHVIRINAGLHAVPDGMVYRPQVAQGTLLIEGGYADCAAADPTGAPDSEAGRSVLDASGGLARSVLELQLDGRVDAIALRRIVLRGGDAIDPAGRYDQGGGLAVFGNASVRLGAGTRISDNSAGNGGGVALAGSRINASESMTLAELVIDDNAEIVANSASGNGGGIYCGGSAGGDAQPISGERHGSVVLQAGRVNDNRAGQNGSGVYCRGSYAGGGLRPIPRPGAHIEISGNTGLPASQVSGRCAFFGTLDLGIGPSASGEYVYGAESGSNGLLHVADNRGAKNSGLCINGWQTRAGASPAPTVAPRLVLQNVWFSGNQVSRFGPAGSDMHTTALDAWTIYLSLRPSGPQVHCGGYGHACVEFRDNRTDASVAPNPAPLVRAYAGAHVVIERARMTGNLASSMLLLAQAGALLEQRASIVDANLVTGADTVIYEVGLDRFSSSMVLLHNTVTGNQHERFLLLTSGGSMLLQGNVLHGDGTRLLRFGDSIPRKLLLRWCNHLDRLDDPGYIGASTEEDGLGPLVTLAGALALASDFTPPPDLIDHCSTPLAPDMNSEPLIDFYGRRFGWPLLVPGNLHRPADLGAVEAPVDELFWERFEP